jgi:hypothetical protein
MLGYAVSAATHRGEDKGMRWPFRSKRDTDIRIFRDPKTDEITLRLVGPFSWPSEDAAIHIALNVTLDTKLNDEAVQRLYEQLSYFAKDRIASQPDQES